MASLTESNAVPDLVSQLRIFFDREDVMSFQWKYSAIWFIEPTLAE
jgi:hypothetical protein